MRFSAIRTFIKSPKNVFHDIFIGVLIALVSIPISMGYASVAGLPVVYGLYGSLLPVLLFALISTSPRVVFGVDAAPAAIVGGMIASMGVAAESAQAMSVIPVVTLLAGLWLLLFFFLRANRILKFISQPVMGGFITGIGCTIILMQVPKLFGGTSGHGEVISLVTHIVRQARLIFNMPSFLLGIGTVIIILVCKKFVPKFPVQPILMFLGVIFAYFLPDLLKKLGISTLPQVQKGLPTFSLPDFSFFSAGRASKIIFTSFSVAVVILSETLLATTNFARKYDDKISARREIAAYAAGNLAAAFCGCCPINGSISRTGIASQFGVKSQLMSITASLVMAFILAFGTGFIAYLPVPVLTGIVIAALMGTLEFSLASKMRKADHIEFVIFYAAFFAVLFLGSIYGVLVGILLAMFTFIIRQSKPATDFLGIVPGLKGYYSLTNRNSQAQPLKGVVLYRFSAPLFYANISQFCDEIQNAIYDVRRKEKVRVVVVDASGISSVDASAAERLLELYKKLSALGIQFYMAGHVSAVNEQLRTFGAQELIEKRVARERILYALKDAGFEPPYTQDMAENWKETDSEEELTNPKEYTIHHAEFDWAFGHNAKDLANDIQFERYFENLAMRNPELAKELAEIISKDEDSKA